MSTHKTIKRLSEKAIVEQKSSPRALPRQTINNQSRAPRPLQEVQINRYIRKETAPVVRKSNTPGNNMNF
jgi:hypothetical protein